MSGGNQGGIALDWNFFVSLRRGLEETDEGVQDNSTNCTEPPKGFTMGEVDVLFFPVEQLQRGKEIKVRPWSYSQREGYTRPV